MSTEIITTTLVKNKRHRRTTDVLAVLDQQILNALSACWPQSVRHIFYKMTDPGLAVPVPKSDHGAGNGYAVVQRRMSQMRVNGSLPYSWVTDYTRRGFHVRTYGSATEFLRRTAGLYRADAWKLADSYVEVWCESRSIAGVIENLCDDLGVSLYPSGGFSSLTLVFNCAEYIKENLAEAGKPVNVIYIGDYDPAGVLIDKDIERKLRSHLGVGADLTFHRVGINQAQVREFNLPTKPRKPGDRRSLHVEEAVEAEAMPAEILLRLLRGKIETFMPENALRVARAAEDSEKQLLRIFARAFEEGRRASP